MTYRDRIAALRAAPEKLWIVTVSGKPAKTFANKEEAEHLAMALLLEGKAVECTAYSALAADDRAATEPPPDLPLDCSSDATFRRLETRLEAMTRCLTQICNDKALRGDLFRTVAAGALSADEWLSGKTDQELREEISARAGHLLQTGGLEGAWDTQPSFDLYDKVRAVVVGLLLNRIGTAARLERSEIEHPPDLPLAEGSVWERDSAIREADGVCVELSRNAPNRAAIVWIDGKPCWFQNVLALARRAGVV